MQNENDPRKPKDAKPQHMYDIPMNANTNRNGGDDELANSSPNDERSDEKVIVNEQRSDKIVNTPAQTAANTSETKGSDEEIVNNP